MRAWILLCLLQAFLSQSAEAKRFDPFVIDPLMRRSPLDKNFMRFGRSLPPVASPVRKVLLDWVPDDVSMVPMSDPPQCIYWEVSCENFIPKYKTEEDDINDHVFSRFGRSKQDNFMRLGRGKQDNFMRFGRGKQDNFMRFGRVKQDSFMRLGRGKHDNFMRFGKSFDDDLTSSSQLLENKLSRDSRGKQDNFMRFGRYFVENADSNIPLAMRGILATPNRDSRSQQKSFIRFGKSIGQELLPTLQSSYDTKINHNDNTGALPYLSKFTSAKRMNLVRAGRQPPSKDDSFIRFGRNSNDQNKEITEANELIPQRLKRSAMEFYSGEDEGYSSTKLGEANDHLVSLPDYSEVEFSPSDRDEGYINRRKRSLIQKIPTSDPTMDPKSSIEFTPSKLSSETLARPELQSSLISAGLPNVIVGPEFSLLPDLDPPSTMRSGHRPGDQDFLRLG